MRISTSSVEDIDWKVVINGLLEAIPNLNTLTTHDLKIEETDTEIIIKGISTEHYEAERINFLLKWMLSSTEAFRSASPYIFTRKSTNVIKQKEAKAQDSDEMKNLDETPSPPQSKQEYLQILKYFFNDSSRRKTGLDLIFNENSLLADGKLISAETDVESLASVWASALDYLVLHFADLARETICHSYLGQGFLPEPKRGLKHNALSSVIQECFYVTTITNKASGDFIKATVHFDGLRLFQVLFPPHLSLEKDKDQPSAQIHINKGHLLSYMPQLAQSNVLFHVAGEEKERFASPIYIGGRIRPDEKPTFLLLMIDCSGSLKSVFDKLKEQIAFFINNIGTHVDPKKTKVSLVFFNSQTHPAATYSLELQSNIVEYIKGTFADGGTRLFETIDEAFDRVYSENLAATHNVVPILFTDGNDTAGKSEYKNDKLPPILQKRFAKIKKIEETDRVQRPKFFILYLGDEVNEKLLLNMAKELEGACLHLKDVDDFKEIFKYAKQIKFEREMLKIAYGQSGSLKSLTVPVFRSDTPQAIVGVRIPLAKGVPVEVKVNNEAFDLALKDRDFDLLEKAHESDVLAGWLTTHNKFYDESEDEHNDDEVSENEDSKAARTSQSAHALVGSSFGVAIKKPAPNAEVTGTVAGLIRKASQCTIC